MHRRAVLKLAGGALLSSAVASCVGRPESGHATPVTPSQALSTADSRATINPPAGFPGTLNDGSHQGVTYSDGVFRSQQLRGADAPWLVLYPPGHRRGDRLPVLLTLHGTGGDQGTPWALNWAANSARLIREGFPPFAVAGIRGGNTWWHPRESGVNSSALVIEEFIPLLGRLGLDVGRKAIYGCSMGGVGAIYISAMLGSDEVRSLVVASAPLNYEWFRTKISARGPYDTPTDLNANGPLARWPELEGIPIRMDIGDRDPFLASNLDFVPWAEPRPDFHVSPGGHDAEFWGSVSYDQLRFVASSFRR